MAELNSVRPLPDDGRRGPRLEIDEFLLDNEMTNLFLLALYNLQRDSLVPGKDDKPNWNKFYAIGAIHGQPLEDYAGIKKTVEGNWIGYCHHSKPTFPVWHRPYMALLELALYEEMVQIAGAYQSDADKSIYQDAAARFRLPYWDLIMPRNELKPQARSDTVFGFPEAFKNKTVFVKQPTPDSKTDKDGYNTIDNPLFCFKFPGADDFDKYKRSKVNMNSKVYNTAETTRIPGGNAQTSNDYCDMAVQRQAVARATMLWHMLNPDITDKDVVGRQASGHIKINDYRTWEQFATRAEGNVVVAEGQKFVMPSLESWHDGIHVLLGTGQYYDATGTFKKGGRDIDHVQAMRAGQMGNPAWAAFDPVFFLHHCNIDRLLAIYQALFPDKYCNESDLAVQLLPFLNGKADSECYTAADTLVKDYWSSGFAVPGNKAPDVQTSQADVRAALKKYLTDTYFWATNGSPSKDTLPNWPKDLTGSWALHGPKAIVKAQVSRQFTAIKMRKGAPEVLAQELTLPEPQFSESQPTDSIPFKLQETAVVAQNVLSVANSINESLPQGAFIEPTAGQTPVQVTWNARVKVRKYAYDGSFSVHLFLGHVKDEQPERFMTKKNEIGFAGIFARSKDEIDGCGNCARQVDQDIVVEDAIPLTTMLYDYLEANQHDVDFIQSGEHTKIRDLTPESVVPFLTEQLQWRTIDLTATLLAGQEQQAGLEITISSRTFSPPTAENIMGVYGPETVHPEITRGKPGGFGYVY